MHYDRDEGPWAGEPDRKQWIDQATGLDCLIVRNTEAGNLCGYVGVPPGHPAHGKEYGHDDYKFFGAVEVHGGLTYSDKCAGHICHEPEPGREHDIWWLGFDCGHHMDVIPAMRTRGDWPDDYATYKDIGYVENECARLARQLKAMEVAP